MSAALSLIAFLALVGFLRLEGVRRHFLSGNEYWNDEDMEIAIQEDESRALSRQRPLQPPLGEPLLARLALHNLHVPDGLAGTERQGQ